MRKRIICTVLFVSAMVMLRGQSSGFLPVYCSPIIFLDSLGRVSGQLPGGFDVFNTPEGKTSRGWSKGMAPATVGNNGLIPAKNYDANNTRLFDHRGHLKVDFGQQFNAVTPNYNGFHLAIKISGQNDTPTYYYLDQTGTQIFSSTGYQSASHFNEGFAAVKKDHSWMYIDDLGRQYEIIDTSLRKIREVSAFYDGLSKISFGPGKKCGLAPCYDHVFLNKQGMIILDTRTIFPGANIKEVGEMHEGSSRISFHTSTSRGGPPDSVAYLHKSGRMLGPYRNVRRSNDFHFGYAPIVTYIMEGVSQKNDSVYLLGADGNKLVFEKIKGFTAREIYHLSDSFYYVSYWDVAASKGMSRIYNSASHRFVYESKDDVMGVKWTFVSLHNSTTKRYYVVDYRNGNIVYDTDAPNMIWTDIDAALELADQVTTFVCRDPGDLEKLHRLQSLKSLTLNSPEITELPGTFDFPSLEVLRIDGLMKLKELPAHIKGLKKLSLRDCVAATNLMDMLEGQDTLQELYLINFDLTAAQKAMIRSKYPNAKVVIEGSVKSASSELQIGIDGF